MSSPSLKRETGTMSHRRGGLCLHSLLCLLIWTGLLLLTVIEQPVGGANSLTYPSTCYSSEVIKVGYLTDISGKYNTKRQGLVISGAITYAVEKINSNTSLLGGRRLEFIYNDTFGETLQGTSAMLGQWRHGAAAFFGPEDSCLVEATIAAALNLPMISYKCADSKVSIKDFYSTFARTYPPDTQVVRSVVALLDYYKWSKFSIIHENSAQHQTVAKSLVKQASSHKMTVNSKRTFENFYSCCEDKRPCCQNPFLNIVEDTFRGTRVYVFLGRESDLIKMMLVLRMRGLLDNGEYMVLYVDLESYSASQSYKYLYGAVMTREDAKATTEASRSLLVIVPSPPKGQFYAEFEEKVREYNSRPPFKFPNPFPAKKKHITIYASYLYDAVMLYAEALSQALREGVCANDGRSIIKKIINRKRYQSVTGAWMNIDNNGDVEGNYTVLALLKTTPGLVFKGINESQRPPYTMLPVGSFDYDETTNATLFRLEGTIDWVSGRPPLFEPPCGYDGSACRAPPDNQREIFSGVLAGLFVTASLVAAVTYRNWKYEQEIAGLLWKIQLKEIQFFSGALGPVASSKMSLASQASNELYGQIFTQTAHYKGAVVAVKQLRFSKRSVDIPRETKKEMKLMKEMHQDNINPFIGAYIEPNCIYIVTEYCTKGSLQDILENDDLKLDSMFISSLVFDLISAMIFLHESDLKIHGNLKSSNCVVTSRWVLQVTDFGLHHLRTAADTESNSAFNYCRGLLWKSPELLRSPSITGTQKADVYAFAIVLHEIIAREGPFGMHSDLCTLSAKEIVYRVKENALKQGEEPFRPNTSRLQYQDYILHTMRDAWHEVPERRPDFRTIKQRLKKMRQGMKANIMDNMMAMMEKYANNLEDLVEERTALLEEEKKKTEALLHRMLPKLVAAQLMRGEPVVPETFDAVTIFFSDIVGFTAMSAESTPMEVVTFLNDLYTLFDSIISNYDVYKVETIGDAYMVVSGLPLRNGDSHAGEVASMALELLEAVQAFAIRHRPADTLQLRIGIHTGSVVAAVVGTTMPRYCLFGDTVNTASRMESNGEALKIHISSECRDLLVRLGGYLIEERGFVKMKGKGDVRTWWLVGHTDGAHNRRERVINGQELLPPSLFASVGMEKKRSPKTSSVPRRGSTITFRGIEGSSANLPAFLRLQAHDSTTSIRTGSPKLHRRLTRNKPQIKEVAGELESLYTNHEHFENCQSNCNLKTTRRGSLTSRPSDDCLTFNLDGGQPRSGHESHDFGSRNKLGEALPTLMSDDEEGGEREEVEGNQSSPECRDNRLHKNSTGEVVRKDSRVPLLRECSSVSQSCGQLVKKWHSWSEINCECDQSRVAFGSRNNSATMVYEPRSATAKRNSSLKQWFAGFVKSSKLLNNKDGVADDHLQPVRSPRRSNRVAPGHHFNDPVLWNSVSECDYGGIESTV